MRILVIGDIHIGKNKQSHSHPPVVRVPSTEATSTLTDLIPTLNDLQCDLTLHMGDALRSTQQPEIDQQNLTATLQLLRQIQTPVIHLLGNHELRSFSRSQVEAIYQQNQIEPLFYGVWENKNMRLIWLDLEMDDNADANLPAKTFDWLLQQAASLPPVTKPTIVFAHYSLVPIDTKGTFYFSKAPTAMYFRQNKKILQALSAFQANLFICAHVHMLTHQIIHKQHFISNPPFSENIAAMLHPDNNPGIYSVLDLEQSNFVFTTFSNNFSFGKIIGSIG